MIFPRSTLTNVSSTSSLRQAPDQDPTKPNLQSYFECIDRLRDKVDCLCKEMLEMLEICTRISELASRQSEVTTGDEGARDTNPCLEVNAADELPTTASVTQNELNATSPSFTRSDPFPLQPALDGTCVTGSLPEGVYPPVDQLYQYLSPYASGSVDYEREPFLPQGGMYSEGQTSSEVHDPCVMGLLPEDAYPPAGQLYQYLSPYASSSINYEPTIQPFLPQDGTYSEGQTLHDTHVAGSLPEDADPAVYQLSKDPLLCGTSGSANYELTAQHFQPQYSVTQYSRSKVRSATAFTKTTCYSVTCPRITSEDNTTIQFTISRGVAGAMITSTATGPNTAREAWACSEHALHGRLEGQPRRRGLLGLIAAGSWLGESGWFQVRARFAPRIGKEIYKSLTVSRPMLRCMTHDRRADQDVYFYTHSTLSDFAAFGRRQFQDISTTQYGTKIAGGRLTTKRHAFSESSLCKALDYAFDALPCSTLIGSAIHTSTQVPTLTTTTLPVYSSPYASSTVEEQTCEVGFQRQAPSIIDRSSLSCGPSRSGGNLRESRVPIKEATYMEPFEITGIWVSALRSMAALTIKSPRGLQELRRILAVRNGLQGLELAVSVSKSIMLKAFNATALYHYSNLYTIVANGFSSASSMQLNDHNSSRLKSLIKNLSKADELADLAEYMKAELVLMRFHDEQAACAVEWLRPCNSYVVPIFHPRTEFPPRRATIQVPDETRGKLWCFYMFVTFNAGFDLIVVSLSLSSFVVPSLCSPILEMQIMPNIFWKLKRWHWDWGASWQYAQECSYMNGTACVACLRESEIIMGLLQKQPNALVTKFAPKCCHGAKIH
ncbi:hypothetical protein EDB19DRAFT_1825335 [Suillus lakei]|nr:hypothetical protein EDB19DRAFT_1825335 [Suillus lakei]